MRKGYGIQMKEWLKIFGLSFFSDKIASRSAKRGFVIVFVSLFLSFLFFMFGYFGADIVPFSYHFEHAGDYGEFIRNAFEDGGIDLVIENKSAKSQKKVNSYTSDKEYIKNGYNLIVDTRPSDMLIEFTQVAVKGDTRISYEEYRGLSDSEKEGYVLTLCCTDKELEITREDVGAYEAFLEEDETAKSDYENLDKNSDDYSRELYYLYVKYYYGPVNSVLSGARVPVLRDYYYREYVISDNAYYFYVFDNMCAGSFKTDGGIPVVFGGYFDKCSDGAVSDIGGLIKEVYYDTAGQLSISYFVSTMSQLPMLIFIPMIIGLIMWGAGKIKKDCWEKTFGGCYKIVNSFVWVSAFVTALVTFICGWFAAARVMYPLMPVIFGGLLLARTLIYCITSSVKSAKELAESRQKNNDDIFGGIYET